MVDAFGNSADRQKHLEGPIAAALTANAEALRAVPPTIEPVDVLAAKVQARASRAVEANFASTARP